MTAFPGASLITSTIFVGCLVALVFGAGLAIASSRLIRSVCGLAICCFGLAGLYYFLHSPFLALMEILIYVGAVCVTIVFAIMLAEPDEPTRTETSGSTLLWGGFSMLISGGLFCGLLWIGSRANWTIPPEPVGEGSMAAIGRALLTTYSMAFELISLALLVAILGALAIARAGRVRPEAPLPNVPEGPEPPFDNDSVVTSKPAMTIGREQAGSAAPRDLVAS